MDITEQKRLEREIIRISEQERQVLGNDLHDGLGPHLVGIKFLTNLLQQKLKKKSIPEAADLNEINELITQAIDHTRTLVKGLCPVEVNSESLSYALEELAYTVKKVFKISCTFTCSPTNPVVDNSIVTHLYLLAREAVNNAVKHSKAQKITISLTGSKGDCILTIHDNGIGFQNLLDNKKGLGINIMKYRARIMNGLLEINSHENGGTAVICTLNKNSANRI